MNRRRLVAPIIVATVVIGVLVAYSTQAFPAPVAATITSTRTVTVSGSNNTVTVSGGLTTTTVLGQVEVISATGSQAVLCTTTRYLVPDTITSTNGSGTTQTYSVVSDGVTTIVTESDNGLQTTTYLATYASATNATQSVGYVVTSTSSGNVGLGGVSDVMTCTYLP
jgi:hypothetical protein